MDTQYMTILKKFSTAVNVGSRMGVDWSIVSRMRVECTVVNSVNCFYINIRITYLYVVFRTTTHLVVI